MRPHLVAIVAALLTAPGALAQTSERRSVPREDGNRANGRDYQPTPAEVVQ